MGVISTLTPKRTSLIGLFNFLRKNWYFILFALIIVTSFISAIKVAKETNNPAYPFIHVGVSMASADNLIYQDVQTLKENPTELIGMEKPEKGIINKLEWNWAVFKVFWKFLGNLFLITTPFKVIYWFFKQNNLSTPNANLGKTLIWGGIFMLVINLILALIGLVDGTAGYEFTDGLDTYQKVGAILWLSLPFHGVISLLAYIIQVI